MPRQRGKTGIWYTSFRTRGWRGRERFVVSLGPGVQSKAAAKRIEDDLRTIYAAGQLEVLDAIVDGEVTVPQVRSALKRMGLERLGTWLRELREQEARSVALDDALIDAWLAEKAGVPPPQLKRYRSQAQHFTRWLREQHLPRGQHPKPEHVRNEVIQLWMAHIVHELAPGADSKSPEFRKAGRTANRYFSAIRSLGRWLKMRDHIDKAPRAMKKPPTPRDGVKRYADKTEKEFALSADEVKHMLRIASLLDEEQEREHEKKRERQQAEGRGKVEHPYPNRLLWEYLVMTGALVHEECVKQLTAACVPEPKPDARSVEIEIRWTKALARQRTVTIPADLATRLREHCERYGIRGQDLIFARPAAGGSAGVRVPFTPFTTSKAWRELQARIIKERTAEGADDKELERWENSKATHLRHTYCRMLLEAGLDFATVSKRMGHGMNLNTTGLYARWKPSSSIKAVDEAQERILAGARGERSEPSEAEKIAARIRQAGLSLDDIREALS